MKINLRINGEFKEFDVDPSTTLLDLLREAGYMSVRRACDTGTCGVCTVLMDGKPVLSCAILALSADGHEITTVEGLKDDEDFQRLLDLFLSEGVDQCGYCNPGFLITAYAMKRELKNPTDEEIKMYLVGNLCRCSGYVGQMRALKKYLGVEE